jgi:hypothetical protein
MPTMEQLLSLDAKYGLTTLGPPMMVAPAA